MSCKNHPKYRGLMRPRVACKDCWMLFYHKTYDAFRAALKTIQAHCTHTNIVERDYIDGYSARPPRRVCKDCGLAEDGWGVGYVKLRSKYEYSDKLRENIPLVPVERVQELTLTLSEK